MSRDGQEPSPASYEGKTLTVYNIHLPAPAPSPDRFSRRTQVAALIVSALSPFVALVGTAVPGLGPDDPQPTIIYVDRDALPEPQPSP
jgi:hypothetical protein